MSHDQCDGIRAQRSRKLTAVHNYIGSPFEWILERRRAKRRIHEQLPTHGVNLVRSTARRVSRISNQVPAKEDEDLVSIVLDVPRLSCGVRRRLDPTEISMPEFVVDTDDFQIPVPDVFELLDDMMDTHVTSGYRDPLGVEKHESLWRNITSTFSPSTNESN